MKKLYIIILLLIPFLGSAQKIYVDAANTTGAENGTKQNPFNTVEEGLQNCNNLDTVFIAAGEYFSDSLKVIRNITIEGAGKEKTLVHGTFVLSGTLDPIPVTISSLYCLNVRQSDSTYTNAPLTVKNCRLVVVADLVPTVASTAGLTYQDNEIQGYLKIQNSSCRAIRKITNCQVGGEIAIDIISSKGKTEVSSCHSGGSVKINTVSNGDTIFVRNNKIQDSLIVNSVATLPNIIENNEIGTGIRIWSKSCLGTTFRNNTVKKGILSLTSVALSNAYVENNWFENGGIKVYGTSVKVEITDNKIFSDGQVSGIDIFSISGGTVTRNTINLPSLPPSGKIFNEDSTTVCGIKVSSVALPGLYNNTIKGGTFGISLIAVSTKMVNNTVSNSGTGIYLQTKSCLTDSNRVTNCTGNGLVVDIHPEYSDTISVPMNYNVISNNGGSGVRLLNNARLENNTLTGNGEFDLFTDIPAAVKTKIYAYHNLWDHETFADIDLYDIYDGNDNNSLAHIDFTNFIEHPGIPELLLPVNSAEDQNPVQVDFSWKNDVPADAYIFQLAVDSLFTDVIFLKEGITDTLISLSKLVTGKLYFWRVISVRLGYKSGWSEIRRFSTTPAVGVACIETDGSIALKCYPNPFTNQIKITYSIIKTANVSLKIYSVTGVELTTLVKQIQPSGSYTIEFDGSRLKPGIYLCQLVIGDKTITKKLIKNNTL
jgi:hypothetical protein